MSRGAMSREGADRTIPPRLPSNDMPEPPPHVRPAIGKGICPFTPVVLRGWWCGHVSALALLLLHGHVFHTT